MAKKHGDTTTSKISAQRRAHRDNKAIGRSKSANPNLQTVIS
jgi:hypothetical protein